MFKLCEEFTLKLIIKMVCSILKVKTKLKSKNVDVFSTSDKNYSCNVKIYKTLKVLTEIPKKKKKRSLQIFNLTVNVKQSSEECFLFFIANICN